MIRFDSPELLLLAIPLIWAYRRWGRAQGVTGWLRLLVGGLLCLAVARPEWNLSGRGQDVVVIADRSRSMPAGSDQRVTELIHNLESHRGPGDRLGLVTFGGNVEVEQRPLSTGSLGEFTQTILPDGSDLGEAISTAAALIDPQRPARLFVLTDGESNGIDPRLAARRVRELGIPIDFRYFPREHTGDIAIESIQLPHTLSPREPFQFSVWIVADRASVATITARRNDTVLASSQQALHVGLNRVLFRDVIDDGGFYEYSATVETNADPISENNVGTAVVRVDAGPRLLVLNRDGQDDNLVRAIRGARIPVDVAAAAGHPVTQDSLDPYRAVIIENVPADDFGRLKMERLAQFVEDLGGGLMLTGGERSFGTGGYFNSPLDEVLPVSMELREEHRKLRVAIAVALDRSGSMAAPVRTNVTKMDLANQGTAECIRLLAPTDKAAVIAVDSSPHIVQDLTPVTDVERITSQILKIQSMGGGIFVYEALEAAGAELLKASDFSTRHIILFSDAADSENPGDYKNLLKDFAEVGITVSVIGLGTRTDSDAKLLEDVATRGGGSIMFTNDPNELPRLFSQDTMNVARNTFIKVPEEQAAAGIPGRLLPDFRLLGDFSAGPFPSVQGYNLCYLRPDATAGVISQDEYTAPWSAYWYRGLGRVAALTVEADGLFSGQFGQWNRYDDFAVTKARWLLGGDRPEGYFVDLRREGRYAVMSVEIDRERTNSEQMPKLFVVPPGQEREDVQNPDWTWTNANTLEARFPLDRIGSYRTMLQLQEGELFRGPAMSLPYSPEFMPRFALPSGRETLDDVARLSGGIARTDVVSIWQDPPRSLAWTPLAGLLLILAVAIFLLEIAGRRLSLWQRAPAGEAAAFEFGRSTPRGRQTQPAIRRFWQWPPRFPVRQKQPSERQPATGSAAELGRGPGTESAPTAQPANIPKDVFANAKRRAKDRLSD